MTTSPATSAAYDPTLYLVHFAQIHETFRKAELNSLASLYKIPIQWVEYSESSPYALISLPSPGSAKQLVSRSILAKSVYRLWARAHTYDDLHTTLQSRLFLAEPFLTSTFKFTIESFQHKRSASSQRALIESFAYLGFQGPIRMKDPAALFSVFEEYVHVPNDDSERTPHTVALGLWVANSSRGDIERFDLKKREYIGTTSMDAELSLITGNMAQCAPGKLVYDPFVGTGSFIVACSHLGAVTMGSDIDGRQIRGKSAKKSVRGNFVQYGLLPNYLDCFISDLTNTPLVEGREFLDAVVCDPPYGVREGLKVLGHKDPSKNGTGKPVVVNGVERHTQPDYVPPKKPYSFEAMLNDILEFSAGRLVVGGRLCFWMPTANEGDLEETVEGTEGVKKRLDIPMHPRMKLESVCVQEFNKWSRRLLTYTKLEHPVEVEEKKVEKPLKGTADELNDFRRRYFEGFKSASSAGTPEQSAP